MPSQESKNILTVKFQKLSGQRSSSSLIFAPRELRVDVVGIGGGYLLVLMIETPRPVHTHGMSSFIYI